MKPRISPSFIVPMKTLAYHDGALGDVLLSLPSLRRLRTAAPVHLVAKREIGHFLKDAGAVDSAASSEGALFSSLFAEMDAQLRTFLSGFDRACVFSAAEDAAAAAAVRAVVPDTRVIRTIPPDGSRMHAADYRLSQLGPALRPAENLPALTLPFEKVMAARSILRGAGHLPGMRLIGVHPGSGGRQKCWPLDRYFALIERMQSGCNTAVIVFTGEAEEGGLREEVCRFVKNRARIFHAAGLELMPAASMLSLCGLYIGNDSGFSHLAAAVGCATIVLFGPTDPLRWKPLGQRAAVVSRGVGPISRIPVEDVISLIQHEGMELKMPGSAR